MNRRTFLKGSVGLAGLVLTAPYVARAAAGPLTLRFAHFAQEDHPANIAAKQFASRVEARTGGAIKINIFPTIRSGGRRSRLNRSNSASSTWVCRRRANCRIMKRPSGQ